MIAEYIQIQIIIGINMSDRAHFSSRGERKYQSKGEKPSRVLLVCVYDTIVFEISNETIRQKFQPFGTITKLLIFEKGEVTKFFIQFLTVEEATQAKARLDSTKLCDSICKMTIYFSNFSNVDLKHEPEENEFNVMGFNDTFKSVESEYDNTKSSNKDKYFEEDEDSMFFNPFSTFGFVRSKTDNPKTIEQEILKMNKISYNQAIHEDDEIQHSIKKSIDNLIGPSLEQSQKVEWREKEKKTYVEQNALKMKEESDTRSSVLWFSYRYSLKLLQLYNLFSNFGNLSCVVVKKDIVYLKFRTKEFAAIASTYLNNTVLEGNILVLRECPEVSNVWLPAEGEYCECIYFDSSYDRFTPHRSITINPPSSTLHVSSMKREICRENSLRNIFGDFGYVDRVHILQQSNEKNMALVRFSSIEDSFNAISTLHNKEFNGRKMQISFTKSKV